MGNVTSKLHVQSPSFNKILSKSDVMEEKQSITAITTTTSSKAGAAAAEMIATSTVASGKSDRHERLQALYHRVCQYQV